MQRILILTTICCVVPGCSVLRDADDVELRRDVGSPSDVASPEDADSGGAADVGGGSPDFGVDSRPDPDVPPDFGRADMAFDAVELDPGLSGVTAIVVEDPSALEEGDRDLGRHLLAAHNMEVLYLASTAAVQTSGIDLVIISSSAPAGDIDPGWSDVVTPVIVIEALVWDDFGMCPSNSGGGQVAIDVVRQNHPIANGVGEGTHKYTAVEPGFIGRCEDIQQDAGVVVASVTINDLPTIVAYEEADRLADGTDAPARRVAFGLRHEAYPAANTVGWDLFDGAVMWALNRSPTPVDRGTLGLTAQVDGVPAVGQHHARSRLRQQGWDVSVLPASIPGSIADSFDVIVVTPGGGASFSDTLRTTSAGLATASAPLLDSLRLVDRAGILGRSTGGVDWRLRGDLCPGMLPGLVGDVEILDAGATSPTLTLGAIGDGKACATLADDPEGVVLAQWESAPGPRAFAALPIGVSQYTPQAWVLFDRIVESVAGP